jgi:hypothetical protein
MVENNCLMVMQTMADMQKDMVVIFNDEVPIVTNNAFNSFFGVSSSEEYRSNFGSLVDSFVPHPLYFKGTSNNPIGS